MTSLQQHTSSLGPKSLNPTTSTNLNNFSVRVRRQDSTIEEVFLMAELLEFVDKQIPDAVNKFLAYPQSFKYDQKALSDIPGFPEEADFRTQDKVGEWMGTKG